LPKFYADFENPDGRSCYEDVATEVKKLMAADVKGIILDLRITAEVSLNDVVQMSGTDLSRIGPSCKSKAVVRMRNRLYDKDDKVLYKGPLVVMVNTQSASASEILQPAMQDYGRGVYCRKSNLQFGKGPYSVSSTWTR
jgi:carboxyl-terminal processing protease